MECEGFYSYQFCGVLLSHGSPLWSTGLQECSHHFCNLQSDFSNFVSTLRNIYLLASLPSRTGILLSLNGNQVASKLLSVNLFANILEIFANILQNPFMFTFITYHHCQLHFEGLESWWTFGTVLWCTFLSSFNYAKLILLQEL